MTTKYNGTVKNPVTFTTMKRNTTYDDVSFQVSRESGEQMTDTTTSSYSDKSVNKRKHEETDDRHEVSHDNTWPDFDEAIWNKRRWHFLPKLKEGDEDLFSEKWSETEYTNKQHLRHSKYEPLDRPDQDSDRSVETHLQNNGESNEVSDSLDDSWEYNNDVNDNRETELWKDNYENTMKDSSIIEIQPEKDTGNIKTVSQNTTVLSENVTNTWNSFNSKLNKSQSSRPNFTYHRVTSSPRERHKINAYIAVSVVRENKTAPQPSPTTAPTETPWNHARHLHKLQVRFVT